MYLVIIGIADFENLCDVLVAAKGHLYWKKLGKYLGLCDSTLNDIGSQHSKPEECLLYCLSRWLRRYDDVDDKGGPTHSSLKKALKLINKEEIAERISETFNSVGASKGQLVMVFISLAISIYPLILQAQKHFCEKSDRNKGLGMTMLITITYSTLCI